MPTALKQICQHPAGSLQERGLLAELYKTDNAATIAKQLKVSERCIFARLQFHGITGNNTTSKPQYCKHCGNPIRRPK
jgi:hypothetical protein